MGKIRKRRIRWEPSPSTEVISYRLYWSEVGAVDYDSHFQEVGNVTQVILPDDVPSFPLNAGEIEIGITAITGTGNESDFVRVSVRFDFTVPGAPKNLIIEDL
jgi:hypothetical protein